MFNQTLTLMWIFTWCFMIFLEDVDMLGLFKHLCASLCRKGTSATCGPSSCVQPKKPRWHDLPRSQRMDASRASRGSIFQLRSSHVHACTDMCFMHLNAIPYVLLYRHLDCHVYHYHSLLLYHEYYHMCYRINNIIITIETMYDIVSVSLCHHLSAITTYCCSMPILDETWMWHSKCKACVNLHSFLQKTNTAHLDHLLPGPPEMSGRKRRIAEGKALHLIQWCDPKQVVWHQKFIDILQDVCQFAETVLIWPGFTYFSSFFGWKEVPPIRSVYFRRSLRNAVLKPNNPSSCFLLKPWWKNPRWYRCQAFHRPWNSWKKHIMEIYGVLSCLVWHFDVIFLGLAAVGQFLIAKSPIILVEGWSSGWIAALGGEDTNGSGAGTMTWKTELVGWQDLCHTFDDWNLYKDWNRWTPYNTFVALDIMHEVADGVFLYVSCEFHVWYSRFWHDTCNHCDKFVLLYLLLQQSNMPGRLCFPMFC